MMAEQIMQHNADKMAAKQTIPAGYKQSEAGIIPEDWEALPLGGICKVQCGFAFKSEKFEKTGVPILRISNIQSGYLDVNEVVYYSVGEKIPKQFEVNDGDALIAMSGATTGKVGIYNENGVAYLNQRVGKFVLHGNTDIKYIQHVVGSDLYKIALSNMLEQGAQPNISSSQLESIIIRKPTIEIEQKIIADVLSDTDTLIACLAQLIAKKQAIKTAAMQQLLTGRTRMPQFALRPDGSPKGYKLSEQGDIPEDWEIKQIIQFTDCTAGGTPSTSIASYWGGKHPWMSSGELHLKRVFDVSVRITDEGLGNSSTKYVPADSVLIGLAGQGKTRGTVAIAKIPLCTNQSIASVFPSAEHCPEFLFYNLDSRYEELRELSTGDGGRGGLNLAIIRRLKVIFPDKTEQSAIANVLSDMDSELTELEQTLAKARDVKQGMMQQLLTGRIRLPLAQETTIQEPTPHGL